MSFNDQEVNAMAPYLGEDDTPPGDYALEVGEDDMIEGVDEFGRVTRRRLNAFERRLVREMNRLKAQRGGGQPGQQRKNMVRTSKIITLGGTGYSAGTVTRQYEFKADCILENLTFDGSSSGAQFLEMKGPRTIIYANEDSRDTVDCSAYTSAANQKFGLNKTLIEKGTTITFTGNIASDNDKVKIYVHCWEEIPGRSGGVC
jgi:hypothetical protein